MTALDVTLLFHALAGQCHTLAGQNVDFLDHNDPPFTGAAAVSRLGHPVEAL